MKKDASTLSTLTLGARLTEVQNKAIRQYENPSDAEHCVVNIFVKYFDFIPNNYLISSDLILQQVAIVLLYKSCSI